MFTFLANISVETSQAGPGNLEVTVNGGRVPTSAQAQGPHTYAISFTPREAINHTVDLRFNSEHLPGLLIVSHVTIFGGEDAWVKEFFCFFFRESVYVSNIRCGESCNAV